ncbi:FadR/GntR family transcriptional regulator [Agromyces ramosus]|uniref:DNA-binding FadR family transcriptional regulator n=1 Tax=Agromyces ramosus TaxID=33879 RepID=A0ABU0R602_9MICO|nr:FadR/GntR family transcriptional regulator [Agromyces ramosus]MDQ0893511.1 DNA-binding FadR family transcriptional regulator [Agromyces ramosus]
MKQIARVSLVDTVVEQLRSEIVTGAWPVGSRIPSEAELVEALGVSRPSVREGVRALVQVGLLETRQGDGTYVVADNETAVALKHALHIADVREVLTVRRALDVVAAREAASRRTDDDLQRLRAALEGRRAAVAHEDVDAFIDHDVAFHIGIARASQNALLFELYRSFEDSLRDSVSRTNCFVNGTSDHDDFHSAILTAIESGDGAAATLATLSVLDDQEQSLNDVAP